MKAKAKPQPNDANTPIKSLELAKKLITQKKTNIEDQFTQTKTGRQLSNLNEVHYGTSIITCIYNFFNICDICILIFSDPNAYEELEKHCNHHFKSYEPNKWIDNHFDIQLLNNEKGLYFLISWQYDEILRR